MRRLLLFALLAAVTSSATAQRTSSSAHSGIAAKPAPSTSVPPGRNLSSASNGIALRRSPSPHPRGLPLLPFGLFSDSLFSESAPDSQLPAATAPELNLIDVLSALGKTSQPPPAQSQPLLIELQGDRYVRVSSVEGSENQNEAHEPVRVVAPANPVPDPRPATSATIHASTARDLTPAVLVFRDGHSEEVRDYSIVSGIMYARGDYYTDGYWNKKIELTALNLPETLKSNQARGVRFILPNAPNEVVTRP
jgi:hypothetical protein